LSSRDALRLGRRKSPRPECGRVHVEVKPQLFVELALGAAVKERANAKQGVGE